MRIARKIAKYKIYLDRSRTYAAHVQLLLLIKLVMSDVGIESNLLTAIGIAACVLILVFIGYIDTRLGIRSRELENNSTHNPIIMEILKTLKDDKKQNS